ncbi:MAG: hypothetical protein J6X92_00270 [Bacteroidales bacterium]|nr:hypothetical protein [Bacteroidales bacterium]
MKKLLFVFVLFSSLLLSVSNIYGQQLIKVGENVPVWSLEDTNKKYVSLDSWKGTVLLISYVAPQYPDLNDGLNDYITDAYLKKELTVDHFWAFGIVDCKSSKIPNALIRTVASRKAKKYGATILFDYDGTLQRLWGMPKENYTTIILDKNMVCQAVYVGEVPASEYPKVVALIQKLSDQ